MALIFYGPWANPLSAQAPVLTQWNYMPTVGDVYYGAVPDSASLVDLLPGPGGGNQNWDFSGVVTDSEDTVTIRSVANTPYATQFAASDFCEYHSAGEIYWFYTGNAAGISQTGLALGNDYLSLDEPLEYFRYPMTFSDTYTDSVGGWSVVNGDSGIRVGTLTALVDAWGTVTLPSGTYPGVLRIRYTENYRDSSANGEVMSLWHRYVWVKPGFPYPLVTWQMTNINGDLDVSGRIFKDQLLPAAEALSATAEFTVFPNPATAQVHLRFRAPKPGDYVVEVRSLTGQVVASVPWHAAQPAEQTVRFAVPERVANGCYLVTLLHDGQRMGSQRLLVAGR